MKSHLFSIVLYASAIVSFGLSFFLTDPMLKELLKGVSLIILLITLKRLQTKTYHSSNNDQ